MLGFEAQSLNDRFDKDQGCVSGSMCVSQLLSSH